MLLVLGMISLAETLNTWRYEHLASIGGPLLGIVAIVGTAGIWTLNTLPVSLLIGAIIGLLDLQARRELTIIRASGISVWRTLRAPLIAVLVIGGLVAVVGDAALVILMRSLSISLPQAAATGALWMEQNGAGRTYVVVSLHPHAGGTILEDVTFFLPSELNGPRITAPRAELRDGAWFVPSGIRLAPDTVPRRIENLEIPTTSTPGDLGARLASPSELTFFELLQIESLRVSDPLLRSGIQTRLARLFALPLSLAGSLLIAFAFTAGYRRTNKYGAAVLYGIVLGFVVYVVTEMAAIAGSAGLMQPAFAAFAPALVAMVIGTTVLLYREDGRR
ncbi:MAG TPA: LptF/LptG family permease [Alphaproteobacteria bacterium]|nr:LptF/LptG family permease [Alphaproteobacteria bacterium]